jgi:hypothetical protein
LPLTVEDVEKALEMHETRIFEDREYRVIKNLPRRHTKLDSKDIAYATRTDVGWRCEVPQCGATFLGTFAIDVHLQSHGTIIKWYCGDSSCYTGSERAFNHRASFELHVATEHMGSEYSTKAGRRVPKHEVLLTSLMMWLNLKIIPGKRLVGKNNIPGKRLVGKNKMAKAPTASAEKEVPWERRQEWESDSDKILPQELLAWDRFARFWGWDKRGRAISVDNPKFLKHTDGRYVFLSKPKEGMMPIVVEPNYLVQTLTGLTIMDEENAKILV